MANRFCCGFDWPGAATADLDKIFFSVGSFWTISTGRFGNGMKHAGTSITRTYLNMSDSQATWIVGFAFKFGGEVSIPKIFAFLDGVTVHCYVMLNASQQILFYGGGATLLATSTNVLLVDIWYYIEIKVTISDTGSYEVRVNGSSSGWIPPASGDTRTAANASANCFYFGGTTQSWSYTACFDDIYICDGTDGTSTQGAANNDFKGDIRVDCFLPSANGTYSNWTGSDGVTTNNYALVSDGSETTYVTATAPKIDSYNFADLGTGIVPLMTQLNTRGVKTDAGACVLKPYILSSGVVATGTTFNPGTTSIIFHEVIDKDPNAGAAWTRTTLNAAEFGIERMS
jgi:hypothetical protein